MVGDTLFSVAHAAVAEFDRVFVYDFVKLVVSGKQALSNVMNFFTNVGGNVFTVWGVEPSDLPSSLFVAVFFCIIREGAQIFFLGRCHWVFSSFVLDGSLVGLF